MSKHLGTVSEVLLIMYIVVTNVLQTGLIAFKLLSIVYAISVRSMLLEYFVPKLSCCGGYKIVREKGECVEL